MYCTIPCCWIVLSTDPRHKKLIYRYLERVDLNEQSLSGKIWGAMVNIQAFSRPTGYMLTSFGYSKLTESIFCRSSRYKVSFQPLTICYVDIFRVFKMKIKVYSMDH